MNGDNEIFRFRRQAVRDLAWSVKSAPLVEVRDEEENLFFTAEECAKFYEKLTDVFAALDENPAPLHDFLEKKNAKLIGKRFESLIEFALEQNDEISLIASNLQVSENKKTLGEFDFIYFDKTTREYVHLEVAGKFYLWNGKNAAFRNFVSPNSSDNLEKKLRQIFSKQIRLAQTEAGKRALENLGIGKVRARVCLKGYVFYPLGVSPSDVFPENHSRGVWTTKENLSETEGEFFKILERRNWISPAYAVSDYIGRDELIAEVERYFRVSDYPLLVAELERDDDSKFFEKRRIFVLPDENRFSS